MAAVMQMLGWKAQGLRCPDHEINCCDSHGNPFSITLIQMPNGTGKTTTLSLLRAALSGSADKNTWTRKQIMEFQKRNGTEPTGFFELRLLLNERRVTIILEFDFGSGRIYYKTTRGDGQVEGFDPPLEFRRFMNQDFVKFYVFDGELADNILSRDHTDAQRAVESLFQVHLLKRMQAKIAEYWDQQTRDKTAKDQAGYTGRKNRLRKWRTRLAKIEQLRDENREKLRNVLIDLKNQQKQYDSEIKKEKDRAEQISAAEKKLNDIGMRMNESAQGVLDSMREPHATSSVFASCMYNLKKGLDRVKLPESAAREFFEELADEDHCVCGRPIDKEIKHAIRQRALKYLGSDDVSLLNTMKSSIEEAMGSSRTYAYDTLSKDIESLDALVTQTMRARNELDELQLDAERSDPNVNRARHEINRLLRKKTNLEETKSLFEGPDHRVDLSRISTVDLDRVYSIETVKEGVSILEDQVSQITGTLILRRKRDLLDQLIQKAYGRARDHIADEIKNNANERIAQLMPDNSVRVDKIDKCVILEGQSSGSAGENLSIGYAFLATLFNRSGGHKLPFVVDSPANPIDYDVRPKIGQLTPELTDQFIAFVISSERERFVPSLRKAAGQEIKYITLFRSNITRHVENAKKSPGCTQTADGIRVVDEKFFNDFQLDSEEES